MLERILRQYAFGLSRHVMAHYAFRIKDKHGFTAVDCIPSNDLDLQHMFRKETGTRQIHASDIADDGVLSPFL